MKARIIAGLDPAGTLAANAGRIVLVRVDELRSLAPPALVPAAATAQHDLRIAAKRLRYVLETTGFCFGAPAEAACEEARRLQDVLGEIHDADLMLPRIAAHLAALQEDDAAAVRAHAGGDPDLDPEIAARAPHRTSYRGLNVLEVYLRARRALLHDRFAERWRRSEVGGVWSGLVDVASGPIDAATGDGGV